MLKEEFKQSELEQGIRRELQPGWRGALVLPGDTEYELARRVWNGLIERYPALIARPADAAEVARAVKFARLHKLRVAVRGGGHNVAGLGTLDGGLVIDLARLKSVELDVQARTVWVGGGCNWGEVDRVTQVHGLAVPGGVVSDTGVAGLTLGGGYGWLRSKFGLSADNLIGAELVTAEGELLEVNSASHPDLLWALRGGGGNFGIVTRFQFRAHPVGPEVFFSLVFHDGDLMEPGLRFYRDFSANAPDEISSLAFCGIFPPGAEAFPAELHGRPFVAFGALYAGDPAEGERALEPLRSYSPALLDASDVMPYVDVQKLLDEDYPRYELRYYWKSLNLQRLDDAAIATIVEHARRQPSAHSTTDLWNINGAVQRYDTGHAAFFGRQAAFLLNPEANWEHADDDQANIAWVRNFLKDMQPYSDGSRYLNFAGFQEEGDQMMQSAYGEHYRRLAQIKARYDPENFFRMNHNIKPQA